MAALIGGMRRITSLVILILIYHRMSESLEAKLQQASVEYQKLQADLSKAVEARQRLDAQLSENGLVKKVPLLMD